MVRGETHHTGLSLQDAALAWKTQFEEKGWRRSESRLPATRT
jgi:hypothetical protein